MKFAMYGSGAAGQVKETVSNIELALASSLPQWNALHVDRLSF